MKIKYILYVYWASGKVTTRTFNDWMDLMEIRDKMEFKPGVRDTRAERVFK